MALTLRSVSVPDFGTPVERPMVPARTYQARCAAALAASGADWLVVYGDREHFANITFLTGFDPRFEEALLLLGPGAQRIIVVGNECQGYTPLARLPDVTTLLCQSLSLMGQDRSSKPKLTDVLSEAGLKAGDSIGLVGWKYLEMEEWGLDEPTFFVPAYVVDCIAAVTRPSGSMTDATRVLVHPTDGLRAVVDADQIAEAEWGAARASLAVWRIISEFRLGDSELSAAARMGYAGEPMTCHPMLASGGPDGQIIGLRSPTARVPSPGDGITTAIGYWGGLTARGGLLSNEEDAFLGMAKAYFEAQIAWYETAEIGVAGGAIHDAVVERLAKGGLKSSLNPGHLTGHDEWVHSPIRPGSTEPIASGMPFQVDIIPVPMRDGWAMNCEDPVTFADAALRGELRRLHPAVSARCEARRTFVRDEIGIAVPENLLLLSAIPLCLPVFWPKPDMLLARG
jgi:Xaa-Pro aminopeptidase